MTLTLSDVVGLPLQIGSALRHQRVFHPVGVLATGRIERIAPRDTGLPIESADIVGRISKAVGMPGGLPDLIGLAWRMPACEPGTTPWDVLAVSAGSGPLTRLVLRPTRSWTGTTLSTLMPLRDGGDRWWVKIQMTTRIDGGLSLASISEAIGGGCVEFDVEQARGTRPFIPLAKLTFATVIPTDAAHDVSFDPTNNTRPGIEVGPEWLTMLRRRAYARSRRGRNAPDQFTI